MDEVKENVISSGEEISQDNSSGKDKKVQCTVSVKEIFRYATRTDSILMVVGTIAAVAAGCGLPGFSFVFGRMVNNLVLTPDPREEIAKSALIMVYVGIGMFAFTSLYVACWMIAAARQVAVMRLKYFESVLRQDIGWHDTFSPGSLTARITGDVRVVQNGINDKLSQGILNLSTGIMGFVFGFVFSWELTLLMLVMMPFIAIMGAILGRIMARMTTSTREHFAVAGSLATEAMENIRTVQTFGREEHELNRFHDAVLDSQRAGIKKEVTSSLATGTTMAIVLITYTVAFFFSSYLVQWGRRDVGEVISTFFSVLIGSFSLGFLSPSLTSFTEARAAAYHLFEAINRVPEIDIDAVGEPVPTLSDSIKFDHIRFSYPTRRSMPLFADLSLEIKKGQKVAFSGASGCGKSSIIGLLQRFYDPIEGSILIDGKDMRKLSLKEWRNQIGIVSQEPNLFAGTIKENILVGKADATDEEIVEACKQANIHHTILNLPDKYDTSVGALGSQMSGGQKQRLAIARAIIKKPSILLLDEATNALDRKSEMEVQMALDQLIENGGMTVIIIAHRLATIRNVDRIYYFSYDGVKGSEILETGTFDELIKLNGQFAAMVMLQGTTAASTPATQQVKGTSQADALNDILSDEDFAEQDKKKNPTEQLEVPCKELIKWEQENSDASMWRVMKLTKDKICFILLGFLGSSIIGALKPVNAVLLGKMLAVLGRFGVDHDLQTLRSNTTLYALLFLVMAAFAFGGWLLHSLFGYVGEHMTTKLRTMLFRQILRQDMRFFDTPGRDAGTLAGMLSGDCEAVHQLWGPSIGLKLQVFCTIVVGLVIGFFYQWKLTLVALACLPFVMMSSLLQQLMAMGITQRKEGDRDDTIVTEALSNIRTVTSFNLKGDRIAAFQAVVKREVSRETLRSAFVGVLFGIGEFVSFGAFGLCFWYGGKLIGYGEATFEEVIIASMSVLLGAMGAGEAGSFATKMVDAQNAARRVFSVIDCVPDVDIYQEGDMEIGEGCDVSFRNVNFIFPARPNQTVLTSLSMRFSNGTSNGVIGQTGCGKSTIIQLLSRFYRIRSGMISINGKNLQDIDLKTWRQSISIVLQEPNLFSGTVRENIRYSRPDATDEEVEEAARFAHVHEDIIKWPEGYETIVGYKGSALSGGQKQRVAIARGLLRRPKLLLLDEATSALDNVTEMKVQQSIDKFQKKYNVTTVSVAHRLSTIRRCDQIILLDDGHIVERGGHDELMAKKGEYKILWELYSNAATMNNNERE